MTLSLSPFVMKEFIFSIKSYNGALGKVQGYFKSVSQVIQTSVKRSFKQISRVFQKRFQESVMEISKAFQGSSEVF